MKNKELLRNVNKAIEACLEEVPFIGPPRVQRVQENSTAAPDILAEMQINGRHYAILVEVTDNGEPRYARQAVNKLRLGLQESGASYGVFAAPYISARAAGICRENGIGSLDLAGNCFLSFDDVFIQKTGNPNPFKREKYLRSLFSPKAERVLRVLLNAGPKQWKFEEMAAESGVSLGTVYNVKTLLDDQEWLGEGLSLQNWKALLDEWTGSYTFRRNRIRSFYTLLSTAEFENELDRYCRNNDIRYGLTGFSGSLRLAPAVRSQRVMAYALADIDNMAADLALKPVDSGANVLLLEPYDEGVLYGSSEIDGVSIVSPVQMYLDLVGYRGRGEEAAEAVLEQVIRKLW